MFITKTLKIFPLLPILGIFCIGYNHKKHIAQSFYYLENDNYLIKGD